MTEDELSSRLAPYYQRFAVTERVLLTGHSHQAWPDVALEGVLAAFSDAALLVDEKWERAFAQVDEVKVGYARLLDARQSEITLGANTHELVVRFLSALPLKERPELVTTDGEFHSIRRQLDRLGEVGVTIKRVPSLPVATLAERLSAATTSATAAVLVSSVMYQNAHIVPHLSAVAEKCDAVGAELMVDTYHHLNVVPFSVAQEGLSRAFIVGGGYKYCQLGEGVCFLRVPPDCARKPVITGWFAEFGLLSQPPGAGVAFGEGGIGFAGATFDPTSAYRAARVFRFFAEQGLSADLLRATSQRQLTYLATKLDACIDSPLLSRPREVPLSSLGGFLAMQSPHAPALSKALAAHGVATDYRGDMLRLGPAPYVTMAQLDQAVAAVEACVRDLTARASSPP